MSKANESFAERMKKHQIAWASKNGFNHLLEPRQDSQPSWVLKKEHKTRNLQNPTWWKHIPEGHEHLWARALNSSQCFGLNLFGALAENTILAKRVLETLLPNRALEKDDVVTVRFEHTPQGAPEWLGEKEQPTQVDVFFTVTRGEKPIGYLLVEVKFTEHEFGSCRGAVPQKPGNNGNVDSSRCLNLQAVLKSPKTMCWMAEADNGRHYWDFMLSAATPFTFTSTMACPFRQSLYQLMRNQVLAIALVQHTSADWAEFGVCLHPGNTEVRQLSDAVSGHTDAVKAFNAILPHNMKVINVLPDDIVKLARESDPALSEWADWMRSRYDLHL
ncbi:MAG: hypothetical protein HZB34_06335 [Nitrospirae bacterium]|nr:hypothetical protein [Nitrospirota bacterium]